MYWPVIRLLKAGKVHGALEKTLENWLKQSVAHGMNLKNGFDVWAHAATKPVLFRNGKNENKHVC